ncbi:MAG: hypothetical protein HC906_05210 [Bacteroidales bacterium]|nr:hypothetical protein [Bacteroidales bacterium]
MQKRKSIVFCCNNDDFKIVKKCEFNTVLNPLFLFFFFLFEACFGNMYILRMQNVFYVFVSLFLLACSNNPAEKSSDKLESNPITGLATGFELKKDSLVSVYIKNPWQKASDVEFRYLLVPEEKK